MNKGQLYNGELGAIYTKAATTFRVWAPTADEVSVKLYEAGAGDNLLKQIPMQADVNGTWTVKVEADLAGVYYTYELRFGQKIHEAVDPYARTAGVNGNRGMVIDLAQTDPEGWSEDRRQALQSAADAVIYELHIRDIGTDAQSGIRHVGKFLSLTEKGTVNEAGLATGLDHITDLGVTHVHLLPIYDYASVDESLDEPQFNWGYDPKNYNVPEGSYATDPYHGEVRVRELKQLVQSLHSEKLGVIMDVVYNHTFATHDSNLNLTVPDYYYRKEGDSFTNGSGCGNELATEHPMVRKYIVDSLVYWATEYHIDGFRFDLMGCYDLETMRAIRTALDQINPSIILYGEGWTGGDSALSPELAAIKANTKQLTRIASFNDDMRDGIKGHVFVDTATGFVNGGRRMEQAIRFGVVAATDHRQVHYAPYWANSPTQCINYASAHDNLCLWDKLAISAPNASVEERKKMNLLSAAIVLTAQGIPFFQAGEEILRSKQNEDGSFNENSYNASDAVNAIKWAEKTEHLEVYRYYKGLIELRKAHKLLHMDTAEEIRHNLVFQNKRKRNLVVYRLRDCADAATEQLMVIYNANREQVKIRLPRGEWKICVNAQEAGTSVLGTVKGSVMVEELSAMVLVKAE